MEAISNMFGKSRGFEKAVMISNIPDGIRESKNYKDVFMVYSNSVNYRIVDMSVCKCNCPNNTVCSHILSILIRYSNSDRMYLYRLLFIKELSNIKSYFGINQLEKVQSNLSALLDSIPTKSDVIKAASSLIIGIYHRILTRIENSSHNNDVINNIDPDPPPIKRIDRVDKGVSCCFDRGSHKLGYLASLNEERNYYPRYNPDIINSIRSYSYTGESGLDVFEFNKATAIYTKLLSSNYISVAPKSVLSLNNIKIKEIKDLIDTVPPLTDIGAALNWRLNFQNAFGSLLEFITANMKGNYIVTSHRTVYKLKLPLNSFSIFNEEHPSLTMLASQILSMMHNDHIDQYIDQLKVLFARCKISMLIDFIAIIPSELISTLYNRFLGEVLLDRNIKFDQLYFDNHLVLNLYIAFLLGYLPVSVLEIGNRVENTKTDVSMHIENKVEPIQKKCSQLRVIPTPNTSVGPREHIESIRQKRLDKYTDNNGGPISRILDRIASNLYSNPTQVLYELIQNADDNVYNKNLEPSLLIVHANDSLTLYNNEVGFSSFDIESICDLGNSSKVGSACTGEFGIGFKSVFKISNAPYIVSNGYQIKFNSSGNEKIIPEWVDDLDFLVSISNNLNIDINSYNTIIHLPLVVPIMFDISHELILNLKQLSRITYIQLDRGSISETNLTIHKQSVISNQLQECIIKHNDKCFKYIQYNDVNSNIQLSFPYETSSEYVYSCLPIGKFGLNFAINFRFNLTLDRSNLIDDSYNISIIDKIPLIFLNALNFAKSLDRSIYYLIFSTIPSNARGLFSVLNYKIVELLNDSNVIPAIDDIDYVKPNECIYLRNSHGIDDDMAHVEESLKKLITNGLFKNAIASDNIPYSLVVKLNLSRCDLWKITELFQSLDCIGDNDAIELLKIVQYFVNKDRNSTNSLINAIQNSIKFPFVKGEEHGFDYCKNIYIGNINIPNGIFKILSQGIEKQFHIDFLLSVGFADSIYALNQLVSLKDMDLPLNDKKSISLMIIKSLTTKDLNIDKFQQLPIYGMYNDNDSGDTVSIPLSSFEIPLFDHQFYVSLQKYGCKLFISFKEYYPEITALIINNVSIHLRYILNSIKLNTELATEYFSLIKLILSNVDESKKSSLAEDILFPLGKWEVENNKMIWSFEYLSNITNYYFVQYFTISTPDIIFNNPISPNILLILLNCMQNEYLYKSIQADKHLLLNTISKMWENRFNENISNALVESLNFIYNELSHNELDQHIVNVISDNLIFTFFQDKLTSVNSKYSYIKSVDGLRLPLTPLSDIYSVDESFWRKLNISEHPRIDALIDTLKESTLNISSVLSIVIYLYRNMDSSFVATVDSLNIIPGYHNGNDKISLLKPSEINPSVQCANLSLLGLEDLQNEWNNILSVLKIKFRVEGIKLDCSNYIEKNTHDAYRLEVGFIGERIVYEYLLEKYGSNVVWLNQKYEQGLPYDITYIKDGVEKFIEVKSSNCNTKKTFEISYSEWLFSQIKGDDFIIYRVNGTRSESPLITILPNPYYLWKNKKLAFCLSL